MPYRKRKRLVQFGTALGITVCSLLTTGTASAGSNGQRINYYSRYAASQCTTGANQKKEIVSGHCAMLNAGSNPDQDYWWVGEVRITWYYPDNSYSRTACIIPKSQQDGDYTTCYDPI